MFLHIKHVLDFTCGLWQLPVLMLLLHSIINDIFFLNLLFKVFDSPPPSDYFQKKSISAVTLAWTRLTMVTASVSAQTATAWRNASPFSVEPKYDVHVTQATNWWAHHSSPAPAYLLWEMNMEHGVMSHLTVSEVKLVSSYYTDSNLKAWLRWRDQLFKTASFKTASLFLRWFKLWPAWDIVILETFLRFNFVSNTGYSHGIL